MIKSKLFVFAIGVLAPLYCLAGEPSKSNDIDQLLVYGASGRIGQHIVQEALDRGYQVTGVTRDPAHLASFADKIEVVTSDILDRNASKDLIAEHDVVIVSVGGPPRDKIPENYIVPLAAESLIEVFDNLGDDAPRLIFVGSLFTLIFEDGKTLLELGKVDKSNENYAMLYGHQIALDLFRQSDINWTVATPPNGIRLEGRTGNIFWGGDVLLRDDDGRPAEISPEDFAYAVLEEVAAGNYPRQRFNVARRR